MVLAYLPTASSILRRRQQIKPNRRSAVQALTVRMENLTVNESEKIPTILIMQSRLFRAGLQSLFSRTVYDIVDQGAEASDIASATKKISGDGSAVIVMESSGNDSKSLGNIRKVRSLFPNGQIIILADKPSKTHLTNCFQSGADGYLLSDSSEEVLLESMRLVLLGQNVFPAGFAMWMGNDVADAETGKPNRRATVNDLTERECHILRLLVAGMSNKEIGLNLQMPDSTVKVLLKKILRKIDGSNRVQAAVWAVNNGLSAFNCSEELDETPDDGWVDERTSKAGAR